MSFMIQNNYRRESAIATEIRYKQSEEKVFTKELSSQQVKEAGKSGEMTAEEELEAFKKEFHKELSKINNHRTVSNMAINISEDAFKKMKEDPEYKEQILNLIKRDWGSSYAPRNASVLITVGSSLDDYRGDAWPVGYDSEFNMRSQNSFYKKASANEKDEQKELLEEYLDKRQMTKHIAQEIVVKKIQKENEMSQAFRRSDAQAAYNNQILYKQ